MGIREALKLLELYGLPNTHAGDGLLEIVIYPLDELRRLLAAHKEAILRCAMRYSSQQIDKVLRPVDAGRNAKTAETKVIRHTL